MVASRLSGFATSLPLELVAIHAPWDLRHLPDGRGRGVSADVRGNPVADRPTSGTARAGMTGRWGQMRQSTTAELRLDHGKRLVLDSRTGTPAVWLRTEAVAIEFRCGAPCRDGQSRPTAQESGECRFTSIEVRSTIQISGLAGILNRQSGPSRDVKTKASSSIPDREALRFYRIRF